MTSIHMQRSIQDPVMNSPYVCVLPVYCSNFLAHECLPQQVWNAYNCHNAYYGSIEESCELIRRQLSHFIPHTDVHTDIKRTAIQREVLCRADDALGIKHLLRTSYPSWINGQVVILQQTIVACLQDYVAEQQTNRGQYVQLLLHSLNDQVQR